MVAGLGWLGWDFAVQGTAEIPTGQEYRLVVQGQLPGEADSSTQFFLSLPELPLDLSYRKSQLLWRGKRFELEERLQLPCAPGPLNLEVVQRGKTYRWNGLKWTQQSDHRWLCQIPGEVSR